MDVYIEEILSALSNTPDSAPCLVRLAQAVRTDGPATVYAWSTGRLLATVRPGQVSIGRHWGVVTGPNRITLYASDLAPLDSACAHWAANRDSWAAWYESSAGHPPGWGCSGIYYQPPGSDSSRVRLGERVLGTLHGRELHGRNTTQRVRPQVSPAPGVRVVDRIMRTGEAMGPAKALSGLHYRLDSGLLLKADRFNLQLTRGKQGMSLEPGEESLARALAEVLPNLRAVNPSS